VIWFEPKNGRSRSSSQLSHPSHPVGRRFDEAGKVIEMHEQAGEFKEP
jgi:hypothetical protein